MLRLSLLLLLISSPVLAADVSYNVDIPASESSYDEPSYDEPVSNLDNALNPEHRLRKRGEEKSADEQNVDEQSKSKLSDDEPAVPSNVVVLQGLNKVIGRVSTFEVPLGTISNFENLEIIARKCVKSPPDEQPENAALLEIRENKTGEEPKLIFFGWMLSSSPGLSSLEHPVYDITVLSCEYKKDLEAN